MKDHFGFTDEEFLSLQKDGITSKELFLNLKFFDTVGSQMPISEINLYYYIDKKGDFLSPPNYPHKKIARALYNKLDSKSKMKILGYIEDFTNPQPEDD